jgi:hypothetical protein
LQLQRRFYQTAPIWDLRQIGHIYPISNTINRVFISHGHTCSCSSRALFVVDVRIEPCTFGLVSSFSYQESYLIFTSSLLVQLLRFAYPWPLAVPLHDPWFMQFLFIGRPTFRWATQTISVFPPCYTRPFLMFFFNFFYVHVAGLFDLNVPLTKVEIHLLSRLLDPEDSGEIDYTHFSHGLQLARYSTS